MGSRYTKVHAWMPGSDEISAPYIHDRKWGELKAYERSDGWWKSPSGLWVEVKRLLGNEGGYIYTGEATHPHFVGINSAAGAATQTLALTTPYTYNSAGHVVAWRISPNEAKTINNIYYFVSAALTGSPGTKIELRDDGSQKPGSTAHISTTHTPAGSTWNNVSGLSYATTARTVYWICVGAGAGNGAGNTCTVMRDTQFTGGNQASLLLFSSSTNAANGFASNPTMDGWVGTFLIVFSDGSVWGRPFTACAAPSVSSNQRGSRFTSSFFVANLKVTGIIWPGANANITGAKIYTGTNGPSSGADLTSTDIITSPAATPTRQGAWFGDGGYTFVAGTQYSVVCTPGTSHNAGINRLQIGAGSDANLKAAMPGGGTHYYVEESGGAWVTTDDELPSCWYLIEQEVAPAVNPTIINRPRRVM